MRHVPARARLFQFAALALFVVTAAPSRGADGAMPGLRYQPHRFDRRFGNGNSLRARRATKDRRGGYDQPLPAECAAGKAECRIYAPIITRRRAWPVADSRPCDRRFGTERDDRRSRTRESSFRRRAGQVYRRRHHRQGSQRSRATSARRSAANASPAWFATTWRRSTLFARKVRQPQKVAFVLSLANGRPMLSGRGTAADGIIKMAGANNAFDDFQGYKAVNNEAIVAARARCRPGDGSGDSTRPVRRHGVFPAGVRDDARRRAQELDLDGRRLSARVRAARRARRARSCHAALSDDPGGDLPSERNSGSVACSQ